MSRSSLSLYWPAAPAIVSTFERAQKEATDALLQAMALGTVAELCWLLFCCRQLAPISVLHDALQQAQRKHTPAVDPLLRLAEVGLTRVYPAAVLNGFGESELRTRAYPISDLVELVLKWLLGDETHPLRDAMEKVLTALCEDPAKSPRNHEDLADWGLSIIHFADTAPVTWVLPEVLIRAVLGIEIDAGARRILWRPGGDDFWLLRHVRVEGGHLSLGLLRAEGRGKPIHVQTDIPLDFEIVQEDATYFEHVDPGIHHFTLTHLDRTDVNQP